MKNKNAPPAGSGRGASGEYINIDYANDTTDTLNCQGIERFLLHGEEHALSTRELLSMTGYRTARRLQKSIECSRYNGVPILSSDNGYFLPDEGEAGQREAAAFLRTVRARARNTWRTARVVEKAMSPDEDSQIEIDGWR